MTHACVFKHMVLQKLMTHACVLHTKRDGFIEELTMEEVVGSLKRLDIPMLSLLNYFLSKDYAESTHGNMGPPFFSSLEGGGLHMYLYCWKFFNKPYLFHLDTLLHETMKGIFLALELTGAHYSSHGFSWRMVFNFFWIRQRVSQWGWAAVARAPSGPFAPVIAPALDHLSLSINNLLPAVQ